MKRIFTTFVLSIALYPAFSQWTADSTVNQEISSYTSSVILSASTSDGGTFISFYKPNLSGFYDMVIQYVDANGMKQMGADGLILTSYPSNTATFVYNVMVDMDNNFIVCFQDQRNSQANAIVAYKITKNGLSLWETNAGTGDGLYLGNGLAPYPCQLSNGDYIVAWNASNNKIDYQKITAAGTIAWANALEINPIITGRTISRPQLVAHNGDKWGMVFQQRNGTVGSPTPTTLYEKQFDANGTTLWTSAALSNAVTSSARYSSVLSSGDITYIGYYANPAAQSRFDGFLQRVNGDGTLPWGINGSDFSTEQVYYEGTINITFNPFVGDVWAVETYSNSSQTQYGIYAQRFDGLTGARQLTNNARQLFPVSANREQTWPTGMGLCDEGNLQFMFYSDVSNNVFASKINSSGDLVWPSGKIMIGGTGNAKGRYNFSVASGQGVAVWQETRGGNTRAYGQNITCSGNLGTIPVNIEYFRGAKNGSNNLLDWKVNCINTLTANMQLERSADGRRFTTIYNITETAARCLQPFSHTDDKPLPGLNYYRLKMTDADGKYSYSSTVVLSSAKKGADLININPNPVTVGSFLLNIASQEILPIDVNITDMTGRVVLRKTVPLMQGFNAVKINVQALSTGIYQVYGSSVEGKTKMLRFLIQ